MLRKILLLIIFSFISNIYGQTDLDSIKCNLNVLLKFNNSLDSIDTDLAIGFFQTFDESCENKVEYSEWSNELLFKFLENDPTKFILVLSIKAGYDLDFLFKNLESPIHDSFNLEKMYSEVENIDMDNYIKEEVLKRINIAKSNR
ncbi:MAG: hypothetical protein HXY48_07315 [Ignavibacteriaceae bacterium]|nr:hypothetical protein [Ignavibacteriaceae bacterium]